MEAANAAAADAAPGTATKAAAAAVVKLTAALAELAPKLEAVFDDADAKDLLDSSRAPALAAVHAPIPMVARRTLAEAAAHIARAEPVVIVDLFDGSEAAASPITHKWTIEYLRRRVLGAGADPPSPPPLFNVASDAPGRCCRYFDPQPTAQKAGYPYPFAPSTHLYRESFDGFVNTVRAAHRSRKPPKALHYLHEIIMDRSGAPVVAGAAAPRALADDLDALKAALLPVASRQPFFGGLASAKLWMGQRGVVMPLHYDATDNLYVMAWGRKKVLLGEPGQLGSLYRYPNAHPLVGSSQVSLMMIMMMMMKPGRWLLAGDGH